jgi:hypothetical protein
MEPTPEANPSRRCNATVTPRSRKLHCELSRDHTGPHWARGKNSQWFMYDGDPATPFFMQQPTCPNDACRAGANLPHLAGCPHSSHATRRPR